MSGPGKSAPGASLRAHEPCRAPGGARHRLRRAPRGATAVLVAICLVMLCAFLALALNVGHLFSVRGELQNAADSGALAGAKELVGSNASGELASAEAKAADFAARHFTDTSTGVVAESVELGYWGPEKPDFVCDQRGDASADGYRFCYVDKATSGAPLMINAVRVVTARAEGSPGGGGVDLFAGGIIAPQSTDGKSTVRTAAVAVTGGPCSQNCPKLPFVLRAGCLKQSGVLQCDPPKTYFVGLASSPIDTAGLTGFITQNASSNAVCTAAQPGNCKPLTAPAQIATSNGNDITSACASGCTWKSGSWRTANNVSTCEVIRGMLDTNCDGEIDTPVTTQVPVVLYPGEDENTCSSANYNQTATVIGFATVALVSARCDSTSPTTTTSKICDDYEAAHGFSASLCVAIQFLCDKKDDEASTVGCGWWGTSPLQPALVR